ncbi:MAG: PH domain-containing protein [Planctomycetaceae bacterium]|nr:PH domain-containing protein [Planctomycetaceae bacterium]
MTGPLSQHVEQTSRWIYSGVWGVLVKWFKVPAKPPELPMLPGEIPDVFQPAEGFLRYLKFQFWIGLTAFDGAILIGWIAIVLASPKWGAVLALPALAIAILPDIVAYIAIHLQYDTTWYVMTQRSLRIRRGIWTIRETTITFENVQNVTVNQGPVQRFFGIADVQVDTAGGGGHAAGKEQAGAGASHRGIIAGVADPQRIRDLILSRLRHSQTAGLGDELPEPRVAARWSPAHIAALSEIRDLLQFKETHPAA